MVGDMLPSYMDASKFHTFILCAIFGFAAPQNCDFERGHVCKWTQKKGDIFDWHKMLANDDGEGPTRDHTTFVKKLKIYTKDGPCVFPFKYKGVLYEKCVWNVWKRDYWCATTKDYDKDGKYAYCLPNGYFMYINSEYHSPHANAIMESPTISSGSICFSFWYFMYGSAVGILNVYAEKNDKKEYIWSTAGSFGNYWHPAKVTIDSSVDFKLAMEGIVSKHSGWGSFAVDDFNITRGSCDGGNSSGLCTFEHGNCGFVDAPGKLKWEIHNGKSQDHSFTGPKVDHTVQTRRGHYLYVNTRKSHPGDDARVSKTYNGLSSQESCLNFYYHMHGRHQGSFNIYITSPGANLTKPTFTVIGSQEKKWLKGEAPIRIKDFTVTFECIVGGKRYSTYSDIAIDDISVVPGACVRPGNCDFQHYWCTWYNDPSAADDFDWIIGSGETVSMNTGPHADHTGNKDGKYVFMEAAMQKPGEKARIISEVFKKSVTNGECFLFFYHMYGKHIGTLNIIVRTNGTERIVWTLSGNQEDQWYNGQVDVGEVTGPYEVIVEGVVGGKEGDIAIDDFSFKAGSCDIVPLNADPLMTTAAPPPTTIAATTVNPILDECNFEFGDCSSWDRGPSYNWHIALSGGKIKDHTTATKTGRYIYVTATGAKGNNLTALLPSKSITDSVKCLKFWYFMYGSHVSSLSVNTVLVGGKSKRVWSRTGTQGSTWNEAQINLHFLGGSRSYEISFEAISADGDNGIIALDDISMVRTECEDPPSTCSFDNGMCTYKNDDTDDFDWELNVNKEADKEPNVDHTTQSLSGGFLYIDTSKRVGGSVAQIFSDLHPATGSFKQKSQCLTFWYYLNGNDNSTLEVHRRVKGSSLGAFWSAQCPLGKQWRVATATVFSPENEFNIMFVAKVGSGVGAIAVDDVSLTEGPCANKGYCSFDKGLCTYANAQDDQFDWITSYSGMADLGIHGPIKHQGEYAILDTANRKLNDKAILNSQVFPVTDRLDACLTFWYHIHGLDVGTLSVLRGTKGVLDEAVLWKLTGQQQATAQSMWSYASLPIDETTSNTISFMGTCGGGAGYIAIDDIDFTTLSCSLQPAAANPSKPTTTRAPTFPKTLPPTKAPTKLSCNFEKNFCDLREDGEAEFEWSRKQGYSVVRGTGPSYDHTRGHGAVRQNGPGSIRHKSGKCLYVKPEPHEGSTKKSILYANGGCGTDDKEIALTHEKFLNFTKYGMCVGMPINNDLVLSSTDCMQWEMVNGLIRHYKGNRCLRILTDGRVQLNLDCAKGSDIFQFVPTLGWYAYIETKLPRVEDDTARLVSPEIKSDKCLVFWYHMYGAHVNKLNVYMNQTGVAPALGDPIWSKYGSHRNEWHVAQVFMKYEGMTYRYVIEAIRGKGYLGEIAIDDISVENRCMAAMECTFEETNPVLCGWKNWIYDDFDWSVGQGATETDGTGPSADHTYNDANGKYLYLNTSSNVKTGDTAQIESPSYPPHANMGKCFQFWYHMYGDGIGELKLYTVVHSIFFPIKLQWSRSSNQGNKWLIGQVSLNPSYGTYKIRFAATKGPSLLGNIALDDLHMYNGLCNARATCDFENEKCTWKNTLLEDDFDWIVGDGRRPASELGPMVDHTKDTEYGNYMYMDTNSTLSKGKKARLESEQIQLLYNAKFCLKFWYHMSGAHIGTLNLFMKTGAGSTKEKVIWTLTGNQGDKWQEASAPMSTIGHKEDHFQMVFEGIHGGDHKGNIALDDMVFSESSCSLQPVIAKPKIVTTPRPVTKPTTPAPGKYDCNFEHNNTCSWTQDTASDNFDWTLQNGVAGKAAKGPQADHTTGKDGGHYIFISVNSTLKGGDIARLNSPYITGLDVGYKCLGFYYHMFGPDAGFLNVYQREGSTLTKMWQRAGNIGNFWTYAQVEFGYSFFYNSYQIVIEGVRNKGYYGDIAVDDIKLTNGQCPQLPVCDFEDSLCGYTNDPTADFSWLHNKGGTSSKETGPSADHTLRTDLGHYMYTEVSFVSKNNTARLISPIIPDSGNDSICVEFWYSMFGKDIGKLNVYAKSDEGSILQWSREGDHGNQWKIGRVTIDPNEGSKMQVVFEGVATGGSKGDIAIDDIKYNLGYCGTPGVCNFESGFSTWQNAEMKLDQFDWIISSGSGHDGINGPKTDMTTKTAAGKFALAEVTSHQANATALLISEEFSPTGGFDGHCMNFWYYMIGENVGTLNVYSRSQLGKDTLIWTLTGPRDKPGKNPRWHWGQVLASSKGDYQFVLEAKAGAGKKAAIALDDFDFTDSPYCIQWPHESAPKAPTTVPPPTTTATPIPTAAPGYYSCNFTVDKCHWSDDTTAQLTWKRHQGVTTERGDTGPAGDHTTGASGWYVYLESSKPNKLHDAARLKSEMIPAISKACLQFWYHMYGDSIGGLTVYKDAKTASTTEVLWKKVGTSGPHWKHGTVDIASDTAFQILLEGTVGNGETGDIALDDISLSSESCPPSAECDFESPNICGWSNMKGFGSEWHRLNYKTSRPVGPVVDHTYGSELGYFMLAKPLFLLPAEASLQSPLYPSTRGRCLSFWFHKPDWMGYLEVSLYQNKSKSNPIWKYSGRISATWERAKVTIKSFADYKVIFKAEPVISAIGLDDVEFYDGPCEEPGNCEFERDECGYSNEEKDDNFDWLIGTGRQFHEFAPPVDHTTRTALGQYVFILPLSQEIHEKAELTSEDISVDGVGKCVTFWYYISGENVGSLQVGMKVNNRYDSLTSVWRLEGNQSSQWIQGQAPLISQKKDIQIMFIGARGLSDKGKIAIDDIAVTDYSTCPILPSTAQPWGCNFESGFCSWKQATDNPSNWSLATGSSRIGRRPPYDHTTSTHKGQYLLIDENGTGDKSSIVSPPIITYQKVSPYCLSFAYYMGGGSKDTLTVYIADQEKRPSLWKMTGFHTHSWKAADIQLNVANGSKVYIEGSRSVDYRGSTAIDDIELEYGDCPSAGVCTFEGPNMCGWKAKGKKTQEKWQRKSASTLGNNPSPNVDHTYNTKYGHFLFLNSTNMAVNSKSKVVSPSFYHRGKSCVQFFYYMDKIGKEKNILKVEIIYSWDSTVFKMEQNVIGGWYMGQVNVRRHGQYKIEFIAVKHGKGSGIIAIDDFRIIDGVCPPLGNCDFENGDFCSWSQEEYEDDFDWIIGTGSSLVSPSGPKVDHTTGNNGGSYALIDTSERGSSSERALIKSLMFNAVSGSGRCLSFWYYMHGNNVETLSVYFKYELGTTKELMWQLDGNQGVDWKHGRLPIKSKRSYQVLFEAVRGANDKGSIAIDDIEFIVGSCSIMPSSAWPSGKTTIAPTAISTTVGPTPGNTEVDCNFEKNFCPSWKSNSTRKEFDWIRHKGETDTRNTGPHFDHTTKSVKGYYIYLDASDPAQANDTAWLINDHVENLNGGCFEFWYHMYGAHVGALNFYYTMNDIPEPQWSRIGTQGEEWRNGQVQIEKSAGTPLTIIFVGLRGNGFEGDIALDDISFAKGKTCQYTECTFEEETPAGKLPCHWSSVSKGTQFNWVLNKGKTPSYGTGPSTDHTLQTELGHYIYIECSRPRVHGDKAVIISQTYSAGPAKCFTFWYNMHGSTIGNVTLFQQINGSITNTLWSRNTQEGKAWRRALVTLPTSEDDYQLLFQGVVGRGIYGDIALDDIKKVDGECPLHGDCDFENFMLCDYTQSEKDDFDWMRGHGSTKSSGTGPSTDHTRGDISGHYYYIESSQPEKVGLKARLESSLFDATDSNQPRCLQFYRHMYGTGIGELNVYINQPSLRKEILMWTNTGNQGNNWIQSQVPIESNVPFRLVFEAVRDKNSYQGDIAIDDIDFNNYLSVCTYIPADAGRKSPAVRTFTPGDSNCTFDDFNTCRWIKMGSTPLAWILKRGRTWTSDTGPTSDHTTGTRNGYYIYIETSQGKQNETALLRSTNIVSASGTVCFKFAYHMYGADMGSLNIYSVVGTKKQRIWTRSHDQGDLWRDGQVEIKDMVSVFHIEVEGVHGPGKFGDAALDDFVLLEGKCPSIGLCDFEDDDCHFTYDSAAKLHWRRSNGGNPLLGDGPKVDHTTRASTGNYLYLKTSGAKENDSAIIETQEYPATKHKVCYKFWYHLMGVDIGTLNVYIKDVQRAKRKLWSRTGGQGNQWNLARVTIDTTYNWPYKILIEGVIGKNTSGDIAIDDVSIHDESCPPPGSCDFEDQSLCSWKNLPHETGYWLDWTFSRGHNAHGIEDDHTIGNALGTFIFVSNARRRKSNGARIISELFQPTTGRCLSFWYHSGYRSPGNITVFMVQGNHQEVITVIRPHANHGKNWYQAEIGLYSRSDFRIIIAGFLAPYEWSATAIDDINIKDGNCVGSCTNLKPVARIACGTASVTSLECMRVYGCCYDDTEPNFPSCFYHPASCESIPITLRSQCGHSNINKYQCTHLGCCYDDNYRSGIKFHCYHSPSQPTAFPSTVAPITTPAPSSYDCNFEKGLCDFVNLKNDTFDWTRHRGSTLTSNTGPKADHTLQNEEGYYVYIESSFKPHINNTANLASPTIKFKDGGKSVCVRFWYHMYGMHIDTLNVYYSTGGPLPKLPLWFRHGQISNKWNYAQLTVPRIPEFKIVFQGVTSKGYLGDIALDDISFVNGECPPTMFCDFENVDICGWSQDVADDFDWSRGSANTIKKRTGPYIDHTYRTAFGTFLYIDGTNHQPGEKARIESFPNNPTEASCVEFYYNMEGIGIGTLNVLIRRGEHVDEKPAWTLSGGQGSAWVRAFITVKEEMYRWKVIFEGVRGGHPDAHIAIDDISFHSGACVPKGYCDFEDNDICGYENAPTNTRDWLVQTGTLERAARYNTGPTTDHTTGLATGHYIYSIGQAYNPKGKSQLISEKFEVNPTYRWCAEFWYHMNGEGIEALRLYARYVNESTVDTFVYNKVFEEIGNHDDRWMLGQANITIGYNFQVVFEAFPNNGRSALSVISLDDIKVNAGLCKAITPPVIKRCEVRCRDYTCIPTNKVCDFFPDCANKGRHRDDDSDEKGCDQCDFESASCIWKDNSKGLFKWHRLRANRGNGTTPKQDHTTGNGTGHIIFISPMLGKKTDIAEFVSPVIKQSAATCVLTFWHYNYGNLYNALTVYILIGERLTELWKSGASHRSKGVKWEKATLYIARRKEPFTIKFKVKPGYVDSTFSMDDIKFENCSLPKPAASCPVTHFLCRKTHACVPLDRLCDFTDDCGDGSDEETCLEENYPYRCDFEDDFCSWEDLKGIGKGRYSSFERKRGFYLSSGPFYDHTTGTFAGHYIAGDTYQPWYARLASPPLKPATGACQIRFYFFYRTRGVSTFKVKTRDTVGGPENTAWSPKGDIWVKWERMSVPLKSAKPFQVIFELHVRYHGTVLLDDVSFFGCSAYSGALPTLPPPVVTVPSTTHPPVTTAPVITTKPSTTHPPVTTASSTTHPPVTTAPSTTHPPVTTTPSPTTKPKPVTSLPPLITTKPSTTPAKGSCLCHNNGSCIDKTFKCDYLKDCPDGEDEVNCGSCDFTKGFCGYYTMMEGLIFDRKSPDAERGPLTDHTTNSTNGFFAITVSQYSNYRHIAYITKRQLEKSSPSCVLEFYYYYNSTDVATLWVERSVNRYEHDTMLAKVELLSVDRWHRVLVGIGHNSDHWGISIRADQEWIAVDDINFINCSFPRPSKPCTANQFQCNNQACIDLDKKCDFAWDCKDGEDEYHHICSDYKEKCTFEDDFCHWEQDSSDELDWSRGTGETTSRNIGPPADHTKGNSEGYFLFIDPSNVYDNKKARLASVVFKGGAKKPCRMRLFAHTIGSNPQTLTFYEQFSDKDMKMKSNVTLDVPAFPGNNWKPVVIEFEAAKDYRVVLEAIIDPTFEGGVAIDDISFTPDCQPDPGAFLPGHTGCKDGEFSCGDGKCISAYKVCNFVADCESKLDEDLCHSSCDFEEDTCGWDNAGNNVIDWSLGQRWQSLTTPLPPLDSSKNIGVHGATFKVLPHKESVEDGWHLASIKNVRSSMQAAKQVLQKEAKFVECGLEDGSITGWGKNYEIRPGKYNFRDKLVMMTTSASGVNFKVVPIKSSLAKGWKLASIKDVRSNMKKVKQMLSHKFRWIICALSDGSVAGPGHQYQIRKGDRGFGCKLIMSFEGQFLQMNNDPPPDEIDYPFADFVSPIFNHGSYDCEFSFFYKMIHNHTQGNSAWLNVLYRKNGRNTKLFTDTKTTGDSWTQASVELPKCPSNFRIAFDGIRNSAVKTTVNIDNWKFNCAEKKPSACNFNTQFECKVSKQCVPKEAVCDMERNCCDGTDEDENICKGFTKFDFQSGFQGWTQLENNDFDFILRTGWTGSLTGPRTDHTLQEDHGKYIFARVNEVQSNQQAAIASPTIAATKECVVQFWYTFRKKAEGSLSLHTTSNYGVIDRYWWQIWRIPGPGWKKAMRKIKSDVDFQIVFVARTNGSHESDIALDDISLSPGCRLNGKVLPGSPTPPPADSCSPNFQCGKSGKCIPLNEVCDFENDCPDGSDESPAMCGSRQSFEKGLGAWKNLESADYLFELRHDATVLLAASNASEKKRGKYASLDVANKQRNGKSILRSALYQQTFSTCLFSFSYRMRGPDVGRLVIGLRFENGPPTQLFEIRGDQGEKWLRSEVSIGRRRHPFHVDITAYVGAGDSGDISVDDIAFGNCELPPKCDKTSDDFFKCRNGLCVDPSQVCDFVDDCGDLSDEDNKITCASYSGCDFESCTLKHGDYSSTFKNDFDWTLYSGPTPSLNTGPMHDHTFQTLSGKYMYIEASNRKKNDRARLSTPPITPAANGSCLVTFYYNMNGKSIGELNVYTEPIVRNNNSMQAIELNFSGDQGPDWHRAELDLSHLTETFSLIIEGIIGKDGGYEGDIAIDDFVFSPDCLIDTWSFPSYQACASNEFSCVSNGKCIPLTSICDGNLQCNDGSDEMDCKINPGKRTGSRAKTSSIIGGSIGAITLLLLIVLITYIMIMRRRKDKLHLFSVFYDPTKEGGKQNGKPSGGKQEVVISDATEGVVNPVYAEEPIGEFSMGEMNTDMFNDFIEIPDYTISPSSMANPLYQDPYIEDDESPLSEF